jgi:polysaccharide deacetylase family protein (PEP-CTERM system associated)
MKNALSVDVEDWFQVENLRAVFPRESWAAQPLRVRIGVDFVLELLAERRARATFFVLGWIAERHPELVRDIAQAGHEIASHGYDHDLVYQLGRDRFRGDVRRSKALLEDITGQAVLGYRAPSFSITRESLWAPEILTEEGFKYDSSVFPVGTHNRYGLSDYGTEPFDWSTGLREIPLAVGSVGSLRVPIAGGGYFRLFPYFVSRALLRRINAQGKPFTFYLHPWELDPDQPRERRVAPLLRFRHYVNLRRTRDRLRALVEDFEFDSIRDCYGLAREAA